MKNEFFINVVCEIINVVYEILISKLLFYIKFNVKLVLNMVLSHVYFNVKPIIMTVVFQILKLNSASQS